MVLRFLTFFIGILLFVELSAQDLVFTDHFSQNYYIDDENSIIIGSDLFRFLDKNDLSSLQESVNTTLQEEIDIQNITQEGNNTISIRINNFSVQEAHDFAKKWYTTYKTPLQKQLIQLFETKEHNAAEFSAIDLAFFKMAMTELKQSNSHQNIILGMSLAFFINANEEDFKDFEQPNFALKRTSEYRYELNEINISTCEELNDNEIEYSMVGMHSFSKLKSCLALHIYTDLLNDKNVDLEVLYGIKQNVLIAKEQHKNYGPFLFWNEVNTIDSLIFEQAKTNAINQIKTTKNPFFYSLYDRQNIDAIAKHVDIDYFETFCKQYFYQNEYNICISTTSEIMIDSNTALIAVGNWDFDKSLIFKNNAYKIDDSIRIDLLDKIAVHMTINVTEKLIINGYANQSEYLRVDNIELQSITTKYENAHNDIGKVKLPIARALSAFQYLVENKNIAPERIICTGSTINNEGKNENNMRISFELK